MSHPHKAWLALALLAVAGPASASDFTGVLALFIGAPLQLFVTLLSSVPPFAFLALFAHSTLAFSWAPVLLLFVAAAGWIWHNPRSWPAPTMAGLLLVLSVSMAGLMAWDLGRLVRRDDAVIYLIMLMLLAMFVGAVGLCLRVIWPRKARETDSRTRDQPTGTPPWRFNLGSVHQGVLPTVVLLLAAGYGIYAVLSKVRT